MSPGQLWLVIIVTEAWLSFLCVRTIRRNRLLEASNRAAEGMVNLLTKERDAYSKGAHEMAALVNLLNERVAAAESKSQGLLLATMQHTASEDILTAEERRAFAKKILDRLEGIEISIRESTESAASGATKSW